MKIKKYVLISSLAIMFTFSQNILAEDLADPFRTAIEGKLTKVDPRAVVTDVEPSIVEGLLKVELNEKEIVYITSDGHHMFTGDLIEFTEDGFTNTTENALEDIRAEILSSLSMDDTITFQSTIPEKAEIYVFTDVSCGYCKSFHQNIDAVNGSGITVHYLAFPRAGLGSPAGQLMQNVWCSSDRQKALTEAKQTGELSQSPLPCNGPIMQHVQAAAHLGIKGTPAIYTANGRQLGGYLTPKQLGDALITN